MLFALPMPAEVTQAPQPKLPGAASTSLQKPEPSKVSLRPFKEVSLEQLRAAVRAQEGPHSTPLVKAWEFYRKFQGSWQKGATKPSPDEIAAFDAFKAELEKLPLPEWFRQLRTQAGKTVYPDLVFDPKSPGFSVFRQTEETERIKALGIALLTEHELDRHGAAQNGAFTITCLMTRTVFDYELYAFYARFLADAKRPTQAMEAARMSLYLNPEPTRHDLNYTAFICLLSAKDGWNLIQSMIREAAVHPEDAEAVIKEWDSKFKGPVEVVTSPLPK